jgi:hypothetical protein
MSEISDEDISITRDKIKRVRERVLQAEKEKLHLDLPRGINDEIETIVREEID